MHPGYGKNPGFILEKKKKKKNMWTKALLGGGKGKSFKVRQGGKGGGQGHFMEKEGGEGPAGEGGGEGKKKNLLNTREWGTRLYVLLGGKGGKGVQDPSKNSKERAGTRGGNP